MKIRDLFLLFASVSILTGCSGPSGSFFSSAEKALSTFELPQGFKIELVAAEPLISDPVDMVIDEEGRLYVVEMHGYPLDVNHTGKVILLSDKNGDGKMDKRTVFAEGFTLPTGIMRWKKGVLVTDAPNVYYLADTSGDGKADIKKVILTGFALTNPQYLVNNPVYGLDNWIYLAHEGISETSTYTKKFGDKGQAVYFPEEKNGPRLPANANGKIVRFRPDRHLLEETAAATQFGQTFDEWGHHFLVTNDNHIYQEVMKHKYLMRNSELPVGTATESLSDHGNACEVYPITINPENQLLTDVGVITSACGITAYLGGAFPGNFNHSVTFVCEPVSNIVHADRLQENGASFTASRVFKHKEFLASTDAWFRPVNLYIGPDGALYVVDYYREIIEHPEWMSKSAINSGKLYNGIDKGRIYRISAAGTPAPKWTTGINLNKLSDDQLAGKLADQNIWWRRNAQRLLVDRNRESAVSPLIKMARGSSALGRLHALWTLEGMGKLSINLIEQALKDTAAGIRENAIKLAELHLKKDPGLIASLLALKNDPDPGVKYQLLCTLGSVNTPKVEAARQQILFENIQDKWIQVAALTGASIHPERLLEKVISKYNAHVPAYNLLTERLATVIGASGETNAIYSLLKKIHEGQNGWQEPLLRGLATGLAGRAALPPGLEISRNLLVQTCLNNPSVEIRQSARQILTQIGFPKGEQGKATIQQAEQIATNDKGSPEKRAEAIYLLSAQNPAQKASLFKSLIASDVPPALQLASIQALSAIPDSTVSVFLLNHWPTLTPDIRDAALNTFMVEPFQVPRLQILLQAIRNGKINRSALGWSRTVILMRDIPDTLKEQARKLLAENNNDRKSVIRQYETALKLKGDPEKGKAVYEANCLICHKIHGKSGVDFGPDLGTVQNWTAESILINILDPNQSISHGYEMWNVRQKNGTLNQGIIVSQTSSAISLRDQYGRKVTIARKNIKSLKTAGSSPMPSGFENKINKQQMADLITFIKKNNW